MVSGAILKWGLAYVRMNGRGLSRHFKICNTYYCGRGYGVPSRMICRLACLYNGRKTLIELRIMFSRRLRINIEKRSIRIWEKGCHSGFGEGMSAAWCRLALRSSYSWRIVPNQSDHSDSACIPLTNLSWPSEGDSEVSRLGLDAWVKRRVKPLVHTGRSFWCHHGWRWRRSRKEEKLWAYGSSIITGQGRLGVDIVAGRNYLRVSSRSRSTTGRPTEMVIRTRIDPDPWDPWPADPDHAQIQVKHLKKSLIRGSREYIL